MADAAQPFLPPPPPPSNRSFGKSKERQRERERCTMYTAGGGEGNNDQIPFSSAGTGCCARFNSTTAEKETPLRKRWEGDRKGGRNKKERERERERTEGRRGETNGREIHQEGREKDGGGSAKITSLLSARRRERVVASQVSSTSKEEGDVVSVPLWL